MPLLFVGTRFRECHRPRSGPAHHLAEYAVRAYVNENVLVGWPRSPNLPPRSPPSPSIRGFARSGKLGIAPRDGAGPALDTAPLRGVAPVDHGPADDDQLLSGPLPAPGTAVGSPRLSWAFLELAPHAGSGRQSSSGPAAP